MRAEAAQLDVARATAESDLTHLSAACVETVQASLDEVSAEVEQLERDGLLASPRPVDDAPEPSELDGEGEPAAAAAPAEPARPEAAPALTADEMVLDLRAKIDRMGPVNMMAIDQFDDLEARHLFLTTQRKDLIDSIAATSEAIKKIDKTTRERFTEAFTVINQNFEKTFTTLFGGGRAGLTMLDESDALESGIDIIAQPPGKRLQSVQLLSGGEKALTAMALMFAIFQVPPEPVLPARRDRRAARRCQHRPLRRDAPGDAGLHAVHPHHPQPQDHGDCRPALRRDDGGAGGVEADFGAVELRFRFKVQGFKVQRSQVVSAPTVDSDGRTEEPSEPSER